MNSDDGIIIEYNESISPEIVNKICKLLSSTDTDKPTIIRFLKEAQYPISSYYAHLRSHHTIDDAKDQERYYTKLVNKTNKLQQLIHEVIEILSESPSQLRSLSAHAGIKIHEVQNHLITMLQAINDVTYNKSKYRPEIEHAVVRISELFEYYFHFKPVIRLIGENSDIPDKTPVAELFVPMLAILLSRQVDGAYRISKKSLPS